MTDAARPARSRLAVNSPGVYDVAVLQPFLHGLPEEQQVGGGLLIYNLVQISKLVDAFAASVALLDYVEGLENAVEAVHPGSVKPIDIGRSVHALELWCEMAARDAVLTVYHFEKTIAAIRSVMRDVPVLISQVEHSWLRAAAKRTRLEFPHAEKARHAVGHRAELTDSVKSIKAHSEAGTFVFGRLASRVYTVSFEGVHRELAIDEGNRQKLAQIAHDVYSAFPMLAGKLPSLSLRPAANESTSA